jgi:hypothetical protein
MMAICGSMMAVCGSGLWSRHFHGILKVVMIERLGERRRWGLQGRWNSVYVISTLSLSRKNISLGKTLLIWFEKSKSYIRDHTYMS